MPAKEDGNMIEQVRDLDNELRSGGVRAANCVPTLLEFLSASSPPPVRAAAAHALRRALPRLARNICSAGDDERLGAWLTARSEEFRVRLAKCLVLSTADESSRVEREECDRALVACAALQGEKAWKRVVRSATCAGCLEPVKDAVARYADLRIWALQVVCERSAPVDGDAAERTTLTKSKKRKRRITADVVKIDGIDNALWLANRLELLYACSASDPVSASARASSDSGSDVPADVTKRLRRKFGEAWLCVLADACLTPAQRASAMALLPQKVIPRMANPLRLSDFLTDAYDSASTADDTRVAVSALDALFVLVAQHRLDYLDFYPKLYTKLTPYALFEAPERERFLSLTATFLTRGTHLPRNMVASFVKRLSRRALVAPPSGAMWCLRLALELLHKHPSVSFLVHKTVDLFEAPAKKSADNGTVSTCNEDPFDDSASDPQATCAEESSLWELEVLQNHMSPAVSRLIEAFSRDVRKRNIPAPPGNLSDYAALDFTDVFGAEFKRRAKAIPFAYVAPDAAEALQMETQLASALRWH